MKNMGRTTSTAVWIVLAATFSVTGCKSEPSPRDNVNGTVMFGTQIIERGIVTLHGPDGNQASAAILPGGRYSIDDPPIGLCQITITPTPGFAVASSSQVNDPHAPPVEVVSSLPKKYAKPGNGLSIEVKPGITNYNIVMTP